jgi:hypothetical protein
MRSSSKCRAALGMLLGIGCLLATADRTSGQFRAPPPLPPRPIIPLLNNGSLSVNANPKAFALNQLGQPVFNFIAAAPLDVRLLQSGTPVAIDRIIPALTPGQMIQVSVPAGQVTVQGPQPVITSIILSGYGANRGYNNGGSVPYWAYNNYPSHNPFTTYSGFFPQQSYSASHNSELYALYNLATAINLQQSQMNPYFGSFSNTSMSAPSSSTSTEANPFAAFDAAKDKNAEEAKSEK